MDYITDTSVFRGEKKKGTDFDVSTKHRRRFKTLKHRNAVCEAPVPNHTNEHKTFCPVTNNDTISYYISLFIMTTVLYTLVHSMAENFFPITNGNE